MAAVYSLRMICTLQTVSETVMYAILGMLLIIILAEERQRLRQQYTDDLASKR